MVPLPFAMWVGEHEGVLTVRLAGRLEAPWAEEVRRELLRHCPAAIRLDLSNLTGIDAPGLTMLLAVHHDVVSGGGRFVLRGVREEVRAMFATAGLEPLVDDEPVTRSHSGPITQLPLKGGRDARRAVAVTPKVA